MLSATATTRAGRAGSAIRSCSSTSSLSGGIGCGPPPAPSISVRPDFVAEDEQVRRAAVVEAERDAGVDRMDERALALHPEQLAAALAALDDEALGGAGDEVGDDRVDRDPPAGDRHARLPGRDEDRAARRAAAPRGRARSETVIFPIAQSEPTVRTIVASTARFSPVAVERSAGGRRRSRSSTPRSAASALSSGSSDEEHVEAVLDVEALLDAVAEELHPRGREVPALR